MTLGLGYIRVVWVIFSVRFLFKTLFSFWRNQAFGYPTRIFNVIEILQVFVLNSVSRIFGGIVRIVTIWVALSLIILILGLTILALVGWFGWLVIILNFATVLKYFPRIDFEFNFSSPLSSPSTNTKLKF